MSELTTKKDLTLWQWLDSPKYLAQLQASAPRGVQATRLARIANTLFAGNKTLWECDQRSLLSAVMVCAQTGLEPGPLGHAAIVPYRGKAQWQAMYKGLLHLCHRSEQVGSGS